MPDVYEVPSLEEWKFDKHLVQNINSRRFASAKTCLVAAGPPHFSELAAAPVPAGTGTTGTAPAGGAANRIVPIGVLQQFGFQQQKALTRLFEIGSRQTYFILGRDTNRATLSRVVFDGRNLLRALYPGQEYFTEDQQSLFNGAIEGRPGLNADSKVWLSLASYIFEEPIGLYIYAGSFQSARDGVPVGVGDGKAQTVFATYLQEAYVDSHSFQVDAQGTLIAETVSLQWGDHVPIT